jgi:hypothetical protein
MLASCVFRFSADASTLTVSCLLAELQGEIEPHVLADFEDDIAALVRESGSTH